jgi:UPF0755 protein
MSTDKKRKINIWRGFTRINKVKKVKLPIALVTALLFLAAIFIWWFWASAPASADSKSQIFVISKGESLSAIAADLKKTGLIRNSLAFRLSVMAGGQANNVQAGSFRLNPSMTPSEIAATFTHGTLDTWLTFPEGWRREQIGQRLEANLKTFAMAEFLRLTENREGRLFPDTYLFPIDADTAMIQKIIDGNFDRKWSDLNREIEASGLPQNEILTLASIVEREAKAPVDRPLVAGILLKRWQAGWPLQVDASVQYAKDSAKCSVPSVDCIYWEPIAKADLQIKSPYNTYLNKGLPPGPICNPGLDSIKAVLEPEASEYWFYLADSSGRTHYAVSADEHAENVRRYLR